MKNFTRILRGILQGVVALCMLYVTVRYLIPQFPVQGGKSGIATQILAMVVAVAPTLLAIRYLKRRESGDGTIMILKEKNTIRILIMFVLMGLIYLSMKNQESENVVKVFQLMIISGVIEFIWELFQKNRVTENGIHVDCVLLKWENINRFVMNEKSVKIYFDENFYVFKFNVRDKSALEALLREKIEENKALK